MPVFEKGFAAIEAEYIIQLGDVSGLASSGLTQAQIESVIDKIYIGVEIAEGFHNDLLKRQENIDKLHPWASTEFLFEDVRDYEFENCSLITSIFTLQFMPPRHRQEVIRRIYEGLNTGGAFIFGEKTVCQDPRLQNMMTFNYYDYKRKNFDTEDIMDKEKTLRHMMKPNTWDEIVNNLIEAGFWGDKIQPFWRNHTFVGAIAIK